MTAVTEHRRLEHSDQESRQDAARAASPSPNWGFPTTRDEEWRFTNVASIAKTQFSAAAVRFDAGQTIDALPGRRAVRLVFINGRYSPELLVPEASTGHGATPLREADGAVEAHLARYAAYRSCVCCVEHS